ncbi:MAG: response regulator, partial [Bacteroidota bacterium]
MKNLRAILIDDELACTETLAIELAAYCPDVEVIARCNSAEEGLRSIINLKPDLVFLDIEMPWMNGFELLEKLPGIDFSVIFVTAYDQFAIKAFRFSAVDYLLKPIDKSELIEAVEKVKKRTPDNNGNEQLKFLLENIKHQNDPLPNIALPTMEGLDFVAVKDIIYCESDNNYTKLYQQSGKMLLLSKPL